MYIDIEICYSSTTDNAFSSFPYMHISMSCEYPRENVLLEQGDGVGGGVFSEQPQAICERIFPLFCGIVNLNSVKV